MVWQDNRVDPGYSVQYPIGNTRDGQGRAISSGRSVVNSYVAYSTSGTSFATLAAPVSSVAHQSQYEMFSTRNLPVPRRYNWITMANRADGSVLAYLAWTDNRDVVPGPDPRETQEQGGFDDGFDVAQCLVDLGQSDGSELAAGIPLARRDAPFSGNNCGNNGGLDQNIYGTSVTFP